MGKRNVGDEGRSLTCCGKPFYGKFVWIGEREMGKSGDICK
jgi:hypothetical protein